MESGTTAPITKPAADVPSGTDAAAAGVASAASPAINSLASVAFSLGWQVAELYQPAPTVKARTHTLHRLPGIGSLAITDRRGLRFDQINSALAKLGTPIKDAGLTPPDATEARQKAEAGGEVFFEAVLDLHVGLLTALTAADFRLGKAYGLGRALFETCLAPSEPWLEQALRPRRLGNLYSWLLDLKTLLPDHAGECVYQSLRRWEEWGKDKRVEGEPLEWERHHEDLRRILGRQGEIWRALLSSEKQATDTLTTAGYVEAARHAFHNGMQLLTRLPPLLWIAIGLTLLLAAGGLLAAILVGNVSSVVAALGGVAAALGISWAGVKNALGGAVSRLETPLWGAALDLVIVDAITNVDVLAKVPEPPTQAPVSEDPPRPEPRAAEPSAS